MHFIIVLFIQLNRKEDRAVALFPPKRNPFHLVETRYCVLLLQYWLRVKLADVVVPGYFNGFKFLTFLSSIEVS